MEAIAINGHFDELQSFFMRNHEICEICKNSSASLLLLSRFEEHEKNDHYLRLSDFRCFRTVAGFTTASSSANILPLVTSTLQ